MTAFLVVSFLIGLFMSIVWNSGTFLNICIKMIWIVYTLASVILFLQVVFPNAVVAGTAIRLW